MPSPYGHPIGARGSGCRPLNRRFTEYCDALGLDVHSLRRSYVTHLIEDGARTRCLCSSRPGTSSLTAHLHVRFVGFRTLRQALDATIAVAMDPGRRGYAGQAPGQLPEAAREVMVEHGCSPHQALVPLLAERGITLSAVQVWRLVTQVPWSGFRCRSWPPLARAGSEALFDCLLASGGMHLGGQ